MFHHYKRVCGDNFSWSGFEIPDDLLSQIKKSGQSCRIKFIVAKAKAILTNKPIQSYLDYFESSSIKPHEVTLAQSLACLWRKKYTLRKRKGALDEFLRQEKVIKLAFKESRSSKRKQKRSVSAKIAKQSSKAVKVSNSESYSLGYDLGSESFSKSMILSSVGSFSTKSNVCRICSGTKTLSNGSETYPCPACSNQIPTVPPKKQKSSKHDLDLGKRKLKF